MQVKNSTQARRLLLAATDPTDLVEIWLSVMDKAKEGKTAEAKLVLEMIIGKASEVELIEQVEHLESIIKYRHFNTSCGLEFPFGKTDHFIRNLRRVRLLTALSTYLSGYILDEEVVAIVVIDKGYFS